MEGLLDPVVLARIQFVFVVFVHFLFVPLSIGLGLFVALAESRYYKTKDPKDRASTLFWAKIFTTTFAIGVATGITMEFSFGTNWSNYARYVGDIFGAPLAAEALLAFFLESVFLGVVLFGRNKISPKLYLISTWLVWFGSALSALWILIANSWMQTPAGFQVTGVKAEITDFFAAGFNPSTIARYLHTVDSVIILASFCVMAIGAYYLLSKKNVDYGKKFVKTGLIVGIVSVILMLPFAHMQATSVAETQPSKFAAMEGQAEDGAADLSLFGWVTETENADGTVTYEKFAPLAIPGGTSFLASWDFSSTYPGLNTTAEFMSTEDLGSYTGLQGFEDAAHLSPAYKDGTPAEAIKDAGYQGGNPPVNFVFQAYHLMVAIYILMIIWLILAGLVLKKAAKENKSGKGLLYLLVCGPLLPFLAIQSGWIVTEVGRQPWVVYNLLQTSDAVSPIVTAPELLITILLFVVFYVFLFVAWLRIVLKMIKTGPVVEGAQAPAEIDVPADANAKGGE